MSRAVNLAIVGATGAVGQVLCELIGSRKFPVNELHLLAGPNSAGSRVQVSGKQHMVGLLSEFDFSRADIAIFSAGGEVSRQYVPIATEAGCVVIDNTSEYRYEPDVPLVVAEVNPEALDDFRNRNIIANPNCSTMQMLVALKPIHDAAGIEHINVCTYQAVSGSGQSAVEELARQTACLLNGQDIECKAYDKQIAFNVLPAIDRLEDNGYTREEMKLVWETRKILGDEAIMVSPTAVRVPVFYGHSEAVHLRTRQPLDAAEVRALLENAPGVRVIDDLANGQYATPVLDASGQDPVFVSRIRNDIGQDNGLSLWIVADNLRKGAGLNSLQIAEILVDRHF